MKILLIDGNSMINRAYYGIRPLTAPDGTPTNALLGFFNTYLKVSGEEKPDGVAVCFDVHAPTFRHKLYGDYKAGRHPTPDDLVTQIGVLKELLDLLGIPRRELAGYEADDLLGTLSRAAAEKGCEVTVLTGDRDALQLAGEGVKIKIATTKAGQPLTVDYDPLKIELDYGVTPRALIDVKALMGDKSDNIPGVPGIGEKTALALIAEKGTLDALYGDLPAMKLTPSVRQKLEDGKESAYQSRILAEIDRQVPLDFDFEGAAPAVPDRKAAFERFSALGLESLIAKFGLAGAEETPVKNGGLPPVEPEPFPRDWVPAGPTAFFLTEASLAVGDGERLFFAEKDDEGFDALLGRYFGDEGEKATYDLKSALALLRSRGIEGKGGFFDVLLAAAILGMQTSLPAMCRHWFGAEPGPKGEALAILRLEKELRPLILPYRKLYYDIEIPLSRVIAKMEEAGFSLDVDALKAYGEGLALMAKDDEEKIWAMAGEKFNVLSPKQLGEVLFEKMGLPAGKKTKSGYATDADTLNKLRHRSEIVEYILDYRTVTKLRSTYAEGLPKGISPKDGRVHSTFYQTGAVTGRLSSSEPNLQNIPVRTPLGRELRKMFTAKPGCLLVDADYSQIELRLLAHISGDETLIEAFNEGVDVHALTASQVFGVPLVGVTPEMRSRAKAVNFGLVYGISDFALAEDIGVSRRDARDYIDKYFATYPGVKRWREEIVEFAREHGYVETLFGRRRVLPDIKAKNFNLRSAQERMAQNAPIQGTAADVIKLAMVRLDGALEKEFPSSRLILQIHDELIVESPEQDAEAVKELVAGIMETVVDFRVKLASDAHVGKTWYEAKG